MTEMKTCLISSSDGKNFGGIFPSGRVLLLDGQLPVGKKL